jgi:uncharacterized membrane protein YhaH (DUF805 family)
MFETLFSFRGRTARLGYFLGFVGLLLAGLIPVALVLALIVPIASGSMGAIALLIGLLLVFAVAITWGGLALHTRRCRDIGWPPLLVIPAWIVIQIGDTLVAHTHPSLALGDAHDQTLVGAVINIGLLLAFLFWPSSDSEGSPAAPNRVRPVEERPMPAAAPSSVTRPAVARSSSLPAKPVFGRR